MLRSLVALVILSSAAAYNNGLARAPPLGWQTWCSAGKCGTDHCFDYQIKDTAKAMVDNGMKDAGFEWIVLDDCWHPSRDANGTLVPFPDFFPDGMKPVIDYVHSLGLKFGLYTSVGDKTCHGGWSPGSYGHYEEDANLFAAWEVDYVKMDYCGDFDSPEGHANFSKALNATGRHIVLELCRGPYQEEDKWGYAPGVAQVWRATGDHHDSFDSTLDQLSHMKGRGSWSAPFGWAYGDMMMTGGEGCDPYDPNVPAHCPKQTDNEYRTEFSLYSVASSPMMIGTDIRQMTPIMTETILNKDALAINQNWQAPPGDEIMLCGNKTAAWVRYLTADAGVGDIAVGLPNLGNTTATMEICFDEALGLTADDKVAVRDVWQKKDVGVVSGKFSRDVEAHDTLLVLLTKQ